MDTPIPKRLKAARKKANITQKNLGLKMGVEPTSASGRMNHYEQGIRVPDPITLGKAAKILNVPLHFFYCEDDLDAELACLINALSKLEKHKLIEKLKAD